MKMSAFFEVAVTAFEVIGVAVMLIGLLLAAALTVRDYRRRREPEELLGVFRRAFGGAILLGLEVLVAADLVKTVTSGLALENVYALGLIVLIRTVLSITLQIEIDGDLPWRRALTRSGARLIVDEATRPAGGRAPTEG